VAPPSYKRLGAAGSQNYSVGGKTGAASIAQKR